MQCEILNTPDEMTDQNLLIKIGHLEKAVKDADDRSLRIGDRMEELKDFVHTDVNIRLATVEERTRNVLWMLGVVVGIFLAIATQLYLVNGRLSGIERDVSRLLSSVSEMELKKASENPSDPQNIQQVKKVLADALTTQTIITSKTVVSEGKRFIDAAQGHPDAWGAALAFLNYKSFLNPASLPPAAKVALKEKWSTTKYYRWVPPNADATPTKLTIYGTVPREQAAVMAPIGTPPDTSSDGDKFVVLTGGAMTLDNTEFRHVIFSNVHVAWQGGPVIMRDVYFVNCTFDLLRDNGQNLADAILSNTAVDFQGI